MNNSAAGAESDDHGVDEASGKASDVVMVSDVATQFVVADAVQRREHEETRPFDAALATYT